MNKYEIGLMKHIVCKKFDENHVLKHTKIERDV